MTEMEMGMMATVQCWTMGEERRRWKGGWMQRKPKHFRCLKRKLTPTPTPATLLATRALCCADHCLSDWRRVGARELGWELGRVRREEIGEEGEGGEDEGYETHDS